MPSSSFGEHVIPCALTQDVRQRIDRYASELRHAAPAIGTHGLSEQEFWDAGLFNAAVEKLRGIQAASMSIKRSFMNDVLDHMKHCGAVTAWDFSGGKERHDYWIELPSSKVAVVECKGALDGNNTNIYIRPPDAEEFYIWSLSQSSGSDPRKNAWSGIHTRLGAEMISRGDRQVDGLVIWDMLCGTPGRPCPKLIDDPDRSTPIRAREVPPPCIYLFPRTRPRPRNNPNPSTWELNELEFLDGLFRSFKCRESDVTKVHFEVAMKGVDIQRKTTVERAGKVVKTSKWANIKRADE